MASNKIKPLNFNKVKALYFIHISRNNFLRAWLAALANPVSGNAFRPVEQLVREADERLAEVEGGALEKLVGQVWMTGEQVALVQRLPLFRRLQKVGKDGLQPSPPFFGFVHGVHSGRYASAHRSVAMT